MRALCISDVHVSASRPEAVATLLELLRATERRLDALFLLGDIFDQWLGDDDETTPYPEVESALKAVADSGVRISAHHGNHDFLLGADFAARIGAEVIEEQEVLDLDGTRTLLLHGDSLCTDDREYQAYRAHTRAPANQAAFLALTFAEREAQARALRQSSAERKQLKSDDIMDVNDEAVRRALDAAQAERMIHGHTHRPAVHRIEGKTPARERIVLGDWYQGTGQVALLEDGNVSLIAAHAAIEHLTRR